MVCMCMFVALCLACAHSCVCAMFLHCVFFHRCGEVAIFYHLCVCAAIIGFLLLMFFSVSVCILPSPFFFSPSVRAFYHRCVFRHTVRFPITVHSDVTITVDRMFVISFHPSFLPSLCAFFHYCIAPCFSLFSQLCKRHARLVEQIRHSSMEPVDEESEDDKESQQDHVSGQCVVFLFVCF